MNNTASINPATGKLINEYKRTTDENAKVLVDKAQAAFTNWRQLSFSKRADLLRKAASLLEAGKNDYGALITNEMGKTFSSAIKEIEKCARTLNYFAGNAEKFLEKEIVATDAKLSYVTFNPLGVILAVMPWNFPFFQVIRFAAPALMAGNTAVLKHASNVQGCAKAIEELFVKAGLPENVFTNLNITGQQVKAIIENPKIAAVTLTGSETAGKEVAGIAGSSLKKCVMELGGSDAYIVLEDVNMDKAVELSVLARLQNNGQTCIAAKRFIVLENIYDVFVEKFTAAMQAKKMGDPFDENTFYGPLARIDLRDDLHQQVLKTVEQGAMLKTGGYVPDGEGAYYPATVLANVKPGMIAFDEELFGPVAAVIKAKDEKEAITLANHSNFGLGGAVLTSDIKRGERLAAQNMEAGNCFVNHLVVSDPRLPFGGIKNSGFGRELSAYGIKEFVNIKTVWVDEL